MCSLVPLAFCFLFILDYCNSMEVDHTPVTGSKGTKCYDDYGRPLRCIPEFENAAFKVLMEATNTCGDHGEIEYCVQTGATEIRKSCEKCYPNQHSAKYLTDVHNQDQLTWWQSETMMESIQYPNQVNLTLRLGKAFDITYVRIWFYSPRPESFAIFKRTKEDGPWAPYQYYSASCRNTYGLPDTTHTTRGEETRALCTSEYSDISPLRGGNVAFSTLEGRPSANNFDASPELQEWVTATDLKITLDRLNTFGDEVFGDSQVLRSYFYAIADVAVGARCKCNGHASECISSTSPDGTTRRVCNCEHNTAGPDCNECQPFYNDAPWGRATAKNAHECKQCDCNGYSNRCYFDRALYEMTGHGGHCLDCSANRDGPNCERCRENYYMREDGYCIACNCDSVGSRNLQCNAEGKCQCKPGVTGDKCDHCDANFYDFSPQGCKNCGCSEIGSANNQPSCDTINGTCYCKENVEGKRCRECKPGFFNLDKENAFGCTPCFCYGHSSECSSAIGYYKYEVESAFSKGEEKWKAETEYKQSVKVDYDSVTQSISAKAPTDVPVYFVAPERFLGNQLSAYNRILEFTLRIDPNDRPIPTATDLVLEGAGEYVTNTIFAQKNPIPQSQPQVYRFRLHEHPDYGWQPRLSARAFMTILTNLTAIKIKGTYAPFGVGYLDDVKLEIAYRGYVGPAANWVETCTCPEGYVGQFCEGCAPGFRHSPPAGGPFMPCIPCDCNKHASICDPDTGRCICEHNTAGDNCELCARGYYGNALAGTEHDCKPCECPNNGACIQFDEQIICTECPTGYTGHRCDSCADGYFGDPSGRFGPQTPCQPCECNLNIDTNGIGNCNTTTGECLKCIYNTGGFSCEQCLPGFYGNALVLPKGDCKHCECYTPGTESNAIGSPDCDQITGTCHCKAHVIGARCDRCEDGYFNLQSWEGCDSCNCDPIGSFNHTCDANTGQCFCRPGVTGLRCDHCEALKYGFSSEGCKNCDCDQIGSRDFQCDANGQCPCLDNVEGRRCDRCKENKYDRQRGCVDCPDCYNLVQNEARNHNTKLDRLNLILDELERKPIVNDDEFLEELDELEHKIDDFHKVVMNATGDNSIFDRVQDIRNKEKEILRTLSNVDESIDVALDKAGIAVSNNLATNEILVRAENNLNDISDKLDVEGKEALANAWERAKEVGQHSEKMTTISQEARDIAGKLEEQANDLSDEANRAKNKSIEAYELAKNAIDLQKNISLDERHLVNELQILAGKLNKTKEWTTEVHERSKEAKKNALALLNEVDNMVIPQMDVIDLKEKSVRYRQESEMLKNETDELLRENSEILRDINEQIFFGTELLNRAAEQQLILNDYMRDANIRKAQAQEAVNLGDRILNSTKETYRILSNFDKQVQDSKQAAEEALNKISEIDKIIYDTFDQTRKAEATLGDSKGRAAEALSKALEAKNLAKNASADAEKFKQDVEILNKNASQLDEEATLMAERILSTEGEFKALYVQNQGNESLIASTRAKVGQADKSTKDATNTVNQFLEDVEEILNELQHLPELNNDSLDKLEEDLKIIEERVKEARLEEKLSELQRKQKDQNDIIENYRKEIGRLQKDVDNVEQIARALPDKCFKRYELEP